MVSEIENTGGNAVAVSADVSCEQDVVLLVEKSIAKFGKIDILINNAGIVFDVPFLERTVEQWKRTLDTNLLGTFLCSKYASRSMIKKWPRQNCKRLLD